MKRDILVRFLRPWGYSTEKDAIFFRVGEPGLVSIDEANSLLASGTCELISRL